jgi:hypothetical protein
VLNYCNTSAQGAYHDECGFASMHIYHVATTRRVTILPARTPKGTEVRTVIKHVTQRLRRHWRRTRIIWRRDSHYGRLEAMEWAENNDADYIFGLAGNAALDALVAETAVNLRFHHAMSSKPKLRRRRWSGGNSFASGGASPL